jgi:PAS domain S-box-containing protein
MIDSSSRPGSATARGAAESPYRALADNLDQCVFVLDREGRHVAVNRSFCQWLGRPEGDLLGRGALDLWPPPLAEQDAAADRRALQGERIESEGPRPRGDDLRTVRVVRVPLRDDQGAVCGVLGLFRDVTEERRREQWYRQAVALEAVGRLASGVIHDFNNMLTVLGGNLWLLRESLGPSGPEHELGAMEKAVSQAAGLAGQLLALARRESRGPEPVDLNDVVAETVEVLGPFITPRVTLEVRAHAPLPPVVGDRSQVTQVLLNLCLNARDAMPHGGRLLLETDAVTLGPDQAALHPGGRPGGFVRLSVSDTGAGIPPEVRARVFEPFFTTKGPGQSTGLGLAIVADVARRHGGWVECVSPAPGDRGSKEQQHDVPAAPSQSLPGHGPLDPRSPILGGGGPGTRFEVYLPAGPAPQEAAPAVPPSAPQRETILLADDDPSVRDLARIILRRQGYRVLLAEDGRQAVQMYRQAQGDITLVLLDYGMPVLSGEQALAELVAIDPGVRVLLLTGGTPKELTPETLRRLAGSVDKPFKPEQLLRAVRIALSQGQ